MKRFLVFLLLISAAFSASAQLVLRKNPLPESPQASEMTRYGTHNVNLYAGRITVNIPVGTYKDSSFGLSTKDWNKGYKPFISFRNL